jgi:hypothetical protein
VRIVRGDKFCVGAQACFPSRATSSLSVFPVPAVRKHFIQIESIEESRFHRRVNEFNLFIMIRPFLQPIAFGTERAVFLRSTLQVRLRAGSLRGWPIMLT